MFIEIVSLLSYFEKKVYMLVVLVCYVCNCLEDGQFVN